MCRNASSSFETGFWDFSQWFSPPRILLIPFICKLRVILNDGMISIFKRGKGAGYSLENREIASEKKKRRSCKTFVHETCNGWRWHDTLIRSWSLLWNCIFCFIVRTSNMTNFQIQNIGVYRCSRKAVKYTVNVTCVPSY